MDVSKTLVLLLVLKQRRKCENPGKGWVFKVMYVLLNPVAPSRGELYKNKIQPIIDN